MLPGRGTLLINCKKSVKPGNTVITYWHPCIFAGVLFYCLFSNFITLINQKL